MAETAGLVLIVEDDENLREPLEYLLRQRRFDVMSADTADAALLLIRSRRPTAAIIDLQLKQGSGREVVISMPSQAPVIIFSGTLQMSGGLEHQRSLTLLVEKPCSLTWLIDMLSEMLTRQPLHTGV